MLRVLGCSSLVGSAHFRSASDLLANKRVDSVECFAVVAPCEVSQRLSSLLKLVALALVNWGLNSRSVFRLC